MSIPQTRLCAPASAAAGIVGVLLAGRGYLRAADLGGRPPD